MKLSLRNLTGAAAMLAAALGVNLLGPHRAYAAPGNLVVPGESDLGVTILSPDPHVPLTGLKPIEISAFYQGVPGNQIVSVDLILDGVKVASKTLDVPETRGVVSFLVDASQVTMGTHKIVIRATAADQEVKSAKSAFTFGVDNGDSQLDSSPVAPLPANPAAVSPGAAPAVRLINPSENGKVQGVVTLRVEAIDGSGKAPYVSLFIDKTFKTLRNFAPYEFEWDTTNYPNGYHTVEVFGYNDSANIGHSKTLRLYVNNPGGETHINRELLDSPPAVKPVLTPRVLARPVAHPAAVAARAQAPRKTLGRPLPLRRPDVLTETETPRAPTVAHAAATRDILRQMAKAEHVSLHFGPLKFETELSTPFAAERPAASAAPKAALLTPKAASLTPIRGFKPLLTARPNKALLAGALTAARPSAKIAHLQQMASVHLPQSDLASPFLIAPRVSPLAALPEFKAALPAARSYRAEITLAHSVLQPALKMHPLQVHFPASLGSLLRSVGQTSLLFNHTTVKLDRPISAQSGVVFGPLRQIFEQGGGTLTWQARAGTVHAKSAAKDILLTIGSAQALVNAKTVTLDGKPYLMTGRTMVPLSFVSLALDADVQYDAATGHLLITSKK